MFRRRLLPVIVAVLALQVSAVGVDAAPVYPAQSLGNRGTDVRAIQYLLTARGFPVAVDGIFGATTKSAVQAFQVARGLSASGVATDATWAKLVVSLKPGDTGPAVMALQRELKSKRHAKIDIDGIYGASTRTAIRTFQKHMGIKVTGLATGGTWRRLVWHFELPSFNKTSLCDYSVGNGKANWGTAAAINQLEAAARVVAAAGHGRVVVGDIGRQHGGNIALHQTHERGLDVDLRLMRKAKNQCTYGVNYRSSAYDRAATKALIKAIRATAPGHVKLIYFNDPVLIKAGLTTRFPGHDDHLHIRYCEARHAVAKYDC